MLPSISPYSVTEKIFPAQKKPPFTALCTTFNAHGTTMYCAGNTEITFPFNYLNYGV